MTTISRRAFLDRSRTSGLALAAGMTILQSAKSARAAPANEKLVLAVIGCRSRGAVVALALVLGEVCFAGGADGIESVTRAVSAGATDREGTLVVAELPAAMRDCRQLALSCVDTGQSVPVQVDRTGTARVAWLVRERLKAGQSRRYRLAAAVTAAAAGGCGSRTTASRCWPRSATSPS